MRKVNKVLTDIPDILIKQSTIDNWEHIAKGKPELIDDSKYKGPYTDTKGITQSSVRDKLNIYYHGKCAYCETYCKAEIEHYRPKKGVNEDNAHNGYYWLCYEWSNLVPACRYCNTEGGKGNKFPVSGKRVYTPETTSLGLDKIKCNANHSVFIDEKADLLHPEIDSPEPHFEFCWDIENKGIAINEKIGSLRGRQTIEICKLNRDYLKTDRLISVLHPFKQQIDIFFTQFENKILTPQTLINSIYIYIKQLEETAKDETLPYTLLRKYMMQDYESFASVVSNYFEIENQKEIVLEAFKAYKG